MSIIISKSGKDAKRIDKSSFEKEDYLQKYIYDNPDSIPLYDIKEDIRLLILAREFPTNSGPVDALGIDKDGEIYLVETKLYKNPDKRLVVAQVLDYGASLWRGSGNFNDLIKSLDSAVNSQFKIGLHQKLKDFFGLEDTELNELLDNFKKNLDEGSFKFVVLMDQLHDRLKDLIIFINQNSQFDIFAVELEYYQHEDYEIMIPKLFGAQVKKDVGVSSSSTRRKWDENSFFEDAKTKLKESEVEIVKKLYDFSKNFADNITWGTGVTRSSFNVKLKKISNRSLFFVYSDGRMAINFGWLNDNKITENYRDKLKEQIEKIKGITIPQNYQDLQPHFTIQEWGPVVDEFISVMNGLFKK